MVQTLDQYSSKKDQNEQYLKNLIKNLKDYSMIHISCKLDF